MIKYAKWSDKMKNKFVRLQNIIIQDFKNVQYGQLSFENNRKNYDASILGLYGQNGSGKTSLIDAMLLLKYALCGQPVPEYFADYVNINAEYATLTYTFKVVNNEEDTEYKLVYSFNIRKDFEENINTNGVLNNQKYKTVIFNEQLKLSYEHNQEKIKLSTIINTKSETEIFTPKSKYNILVGTDKKIFMDLIVAKKMTALSSMSFIFSRQFLDIIRKNCSDKKYLFAIESLVDYGNNELFIINVVNSGLINMNTLPIAFKYEEKASLAIGNLAIPLNDSALIPEQILDVLKKVIDDMNIVLKQIVPGLTIEICELGMELSKDNHKSVRIQFMSNKNAKQIPLKYESEGIKKIISVLQLLIVVYNQPSITVAIDELDAGIFEYLLGELLQIISEKGKGQLMFTSHNLRPLETIDKGFIAFTTTNPANRYIRFNNIKTNNNLRDFYYRDIILGEQEENTYEPTNKYDIAFAFRKAGEWLAQDIS